MTENVGGKLKKIANIIEIIGSILSVIVGLLIMSQGQQYGSYGSFAEFISGLIVMICGTLVSFLMGIFIYAFGQLVENSDICADYIKSLNGEKDDDSSGSKTVNDETKDSPENSERIRKTKVKKQPSPEITEWEKHGRSKMICPSCFTICKIEYLEKHHRCPECGEEYNPE